MAEKRILLAADTWTDLATTLVGTDLGGHLILRPDGTDFFIGVKASTAPTVAGRAMVKNEAVEVVYAENSAAKVWVKSTAGGYLSIDDIGAKLVIVTPSVAVA